MSGSEIASRAGGAARPVSVLMLAPLTFTGGITTWYKILLKYAHPDRVTFETIDTSKMYEEPGARASLRGYALGVLHGLRRFKLLLDAIRRRRPDMVYITCAPALGFILRDYWYVLLCRLLEVPVVLHLHGGNVPGFLGHNRLLRMLANGSFRRSRMIIVITREVEAALRSGPHRDRVVYVPNMMDDEAHARIHARQGQGKRVPGRILHVAWQCKEKGSFDLIRAMAHSKAATSCHMVGVVAPENHQLMQSEIESLGLAGRVMLTGPLYGEELAREFEEASAFVLPTHREGPEGFPMVVLEAMMYGVPVVANNVGNIEEMLTGDIAKPAGTLLRQVDPVDPGELARKIDELLLSSSEAERLGRNGRERVQDEYLASHVVPNLVALLEGIVGASGT